MKRFVMLVAGLMAMLICAMPVFAGVLITENTLRNARNNAADPLFADAMRDSTVLGYAVRALVTEDEAAMREAGIGVLRAARDAMEYLPDARMLPDDRSSLNLYRALLAFAVLGSEDGSFSPEDRDGIARTCASVLDHYLDPGFCDWGDDSFAVGVSALRIVAACALYADSTPDTQAAERYLQHAIRYLDANIDRGLDEHGAWVAGSPGSTGEAIEYLTVTAKILRGHGFDDPFARDRFARMAVSGVHLLTPPAVLPGGMRVHTVSIGRTDPTKNPSSKTILAIPDIYPHYPDEASMAVWHWNRCGNPAGPLGVLFADTLIPYMRPDGLSTVAGAGTVVFRDRFATPVESMVAATFGAARGRTDRERWDHHDSGDFSFFWSGQTVILHDGYAPDVTSELALNRHAWRHSTVLPTGDGSSPVIRPRPMGSSSVTTTPIPPLSDFYPDGLSQFMTTAMLDYTGGEVKNPDHPENAFDHTRQFMFIKPNALVIYDQVSANGPVDWNLWASLADTTMDGNTLNMRTGGGIELQAVFAGTQTLTAAIESPPAEAVGEWPFIMQAAYGAGTVVLVSIDPAAALETGYGPVLGHLYENLAAPMPRTAAIIDRTGILSQVLAGATLETTSFVAMPADTAAFARFGTVFVNIDRSAESGAYLTLLEQMVRPGGTLVLAGTGRAFVSGEEADVDPVLNMGSGTLPAHLPLDVTISDVVTLHDDPAWTGTHTIPAESFNGFLERLLGGMFFDEKPPVTVPPVWSADWQPIATIRQSYPVQASVDTTDVPVRVMVRKPDQGGLLTLLLPRREGEPYRFTVNNHTPSFIAFSDPVTTWEVAAGVTGWTNARLSAHMTGADGTRAYWAFDCTSVTIGEDQLIARYPFSIYYNAVEDRGIIQTSESNEISFSGGVARIHAGEVSFTNLSADLIIMRERFNSIIRVIDEAGLPVADARVAVDGAFIGNTGPDGSIAVGWDGSQPTVSIRYGASTTSGMLAPGTITFALY